MTQEEKQLLLKDLCARLPYGVMIQGLDKVEPLTIQNLAINMIMSENLYLPYLRPMSSMSMKEAHETIGFPRKISISTIRNWIDYWIPNPEFIDWLNSHHFDYRKLIEKGLALEAPERMYKTE